MDVTKSQFVFDGLLQNEEYGFFKDRCLRADGFIVRAQTTIRTDGFIVRADFRKTCALRAPTSCKNEEYGFNRDRRLRADGFIIRAQAAIRTDGFTVRAGFRKARQDLRAARANLVSCTDTPHPYKKRGS